MTDLPEQAHAFDFWIGDWDVFTPSGQQVGQNQIAAIYDGRVLTEHWAGAGGVFGTSLNSWDAGRGCWHQTWMDSTGSTLLLDGGLRDGRMVMEGDAPAEDGSGTVQRNRISWTPSDDGSEVRQLWETSDDGGDTWQTAFDGRYRRAARTTPTP